ncbi:hypothetical protein ACR9E3_00105 [Actinomycetospora sp. C-140]
MDTDGFVDVLATAHVTVGARPAVIEIRQRPGGRDEVAIGGLLLVAVVGVAGLLSAPFSVATVVLAPFVVLFGVAGCWLLGQRLRTPAVRLDCVAWSAAGAGIPRRRSFGRPPIVHTTAARDRYGSADVVLSAGHRSTVVVGRVPGAEAEEIARTLRRLVRERDLTR